MTKKNNKITIDEIRKIVGDALRDHYPLLESPQQIEEASILKNKHPFKAFFMFGPAGSGKGYLLKNILKLPADFKTRNPDDAIEEQFPKFGLSMKFVNKTNGDAKLEQEKFQQQYARKVIQMGSRGHTANLIGIANPLVFDTTGESVDKMVPRMKQLLQLGYDVGVFMNNVPTQASVERDAQRDRTVGDEITTSISQEYQEKVIQAQGYLKKLEGIDGVTIMTPEAYNNIFDLKSGELLQKPTKITPDMLPDELNPEKNPAAFKQQKAIIQQAIAATDKWVKSPEPQNPKGKLMLKAMKKLVQVSNGTLGQNMLDLGVAAVIPEYAADEDIKKGIKMIEDLGGVKMEPGKSGNPRRAKGGAADQQAISPAIRGGGKDKGHTLRGLASGEESGSMKESVLTKEQLLDIVRQAVKNTTTGS
jgi:hypothetical protein